jgi:hypothetical protein
MYFVRVDRAREYDSKNDMSGECYCWRQNHLFYALKGIMVHIVVCNVLLTYFVVSSVKISCPAQSKMCSSTVVLVSGNCEMETNIIGEHSKKKACMSTYFELFHYKVASCRHRVLFGIVRSFAVKHLYDGALADSSIT